MPKSHASPVEFTHSAYEGGPIHGVIGTPELRRRLSPFVFLDHFDVATSTEWGFDWHPHSGVGTFTYVLNSELDHTDTGGAGGQVSQGGVQWMAAGGGIWHREFYQPGDSSRVRGLQLWVTLPPDLENGPVSYQQAAVAQLPHLDDTRVLSGSYNGVASPINAPVEFNYLDVRIPGGTTWEFRRPADHDVAWLYTYEGQVHASGTEVAENTLAVFDRDQGLLRVESQSIGSAFVVGTAESNPNPIVARAGSMHTTTDALRSGEQRIAELAATVRDIDDQNSVR